MDELEQHRLLTHLLGVAERFLCRWKDPATVNDREDFAQEATYATWLRVKHIRRPDRIDAFVRTVSRRLRCHAVHDRLRASTEALDTSSVLDESIEVVRDVDGGWRIDGHWVSKQTMLFELGMVTEQLTPLNRSILFGFYEGFTCAELGARYGMTTDRVKVRLYRSRRKIREFFEGRLQRRILFEGVLSPETSAME